MIIDNNIKESIIRILKKHDIKRAGIFGLYATGTYFEDSDIDILVELSTKMSLLKFVGIRLELEDSLNKKVDLAEYRANKPRLRRRILSEKVRIYG